MMTLLFLLALVAMITLLRGNTRWSFSAFAVALVLSAYWFHYHATSTLTISL